MGNTGIEKKKTLDTRSLLLCPLFAALIAVGAFIRIPVPYVPFTLQILFTTMAGLFLGSKRGFIAVALYLSLGLSGLPVFAAGGGIGYVLMPSFGYLIGMAIGAWVTGLITEKGQQTFSLFLIAGLVHVAIVHIFGMAYFYFLATFYLNRSIGFGALLVNFSLVFLPGDVLSCTVSALLAKKLRPLRRRLAAGNF